MQIERIRPALRERLGHEATSDLAALLGHVRKDWEAEVMSLAGDRFERRLVEETSKLRVEMAHGLAGLRQEMAAGHGALQHAIADQKFEILKWTFIFWTGQFFVTASFLAMLLRALRTG
jgi:hypothetical protein